ncbi:MAG: alpha/beta hydrolase [Candidatus Heimdallarchaeota archaeon]|nr:alpha/beta hydrolase [Candidatus Heimdallarchaeota archaeon]MDH5647274.1 alpha/beta hydrolase [Candidatus Heimdallarchaeota archaeon]
MTFTNNNDVKIYYTVEGHGDPLVLLHGGMMDHSYFYKFGYVPVLKDSFKLILIDMRGHGNSDKPLDAKGYSLKLFADDIICVLDALKVDKCNVYGFSLGGWMVHSLAKYYPNRLNSIILCDGVPGSKDGQTFQAIAKNFDETLKPISQYQLIKEIISTFDRQPIKAIANWMESEIDKIITEVDSIIDDIKVPTLLFMSHHEQNTDEYRLIKKSEKTIEKSRLIHFEDYSHFDIFEKSENITPHIIKFLKSS